MKKSTLHIVLASLVLLLFATSEIGAQSYTTNYGINSGTTGNKNSNFGYSAGSVSSGGGNTNVGYYAGRINSTGYENTFIGNRSGQTNTTGYKNAFLGQNSGANIQSGNHNVYLGAYCGSNNVGGNSNTYMGFQTGLNSSGDKNVFLGYQAGYNVTGSNKLYIENSNTTIYPLIYGDFTSNQVGINTNDIALGYAFSVNGKMMATELKLDYQSAWPDYVFAADYQLSSLASIEEHIKEKGHLPNIPSAKEVAEDGILVAEMNAKLLEKIEELTLHLIQINKDVEQLKAENERLKTKTD